MNLSDWLIFLPFHNMNALIYCSRQIVDWLMDKFQAHYAIYNIKWITKLLYFYSNFEYSKKKSVESSDLARSSTHLVLHQDSRTHGSKHNNSLKYIFYWLFQIDTLELWCNNLSFYWSLKFGNQSITVPEKI